MARHHPATVPSTPPNTPPPPPLTEPRRTRNLPPGIRNLQSRLGLGLPCAVFALNLLCLNLAKTVLTAPHIGVAVLVEFESTLDEGAPPPPPTAQPF